MNHKIEIKIYYEDTDAGGVVYYANYLKYFERARTEFLESLGVKISQLAKEGINFVVVKTEIDYISAAKLGDILEIEIKLKELKNISLVFEYHVFRKEDKKLIAKGFTKLACVDNSIKLKRIPDELFNKLNIISI